MIHSAKLNVNEKEPRAKVTSLEPTWNIVMKKYSNCSEEAPSVVSGILELMKKRNQYGFRKHGAYLTPKNGRNNRNDTIQEILDSIVYVQNEIEELNISPEDNTIYNIQMKMLSDIWEGLVKALEIYYMYFELCR